MSWNQRPVGLHCAAFTLPLRDIKKEESEVTEWISQGTTNSDQQVPLKVVCDANLLIVFVKTLSKAAKKSDNNKMKKADIPWKMLIVRLYTIEKKAK